MNNSTYLSCFHLGNGQGLHAVPRNKQGTSLSRNLLFEAGLILSRLFCLSTRAIGDTLIGNQAIEDLLHIMGVTDPEHRKGHAELIGLKQFDFSAFVDTFN